MPNPGGVVDPDELVGRADELARLHEAVVRGGAHVTGERRMGKTSLLRKLHVELEDAGCTVIRISAETSSVDTFARRLLRELRERREIRSRVSKWEKEIGGEIGLSLFGTGFKLSAKGRRNPDQMIELDVLELLAQVGTRGRSVLIIDEITVLCTHLGVERAEEFLGGLRAERQGTHPLAVVVAGSIGLHHVIPDSRVLNDLWRVEIGALQREDAEELVRRLLHGIGHTEPELLVAKIVEATSGIPFYIQAVVDMVRNHPSDDIDALIDRCILENVWETERLVERTDDYYGASAPAARTVLDQIATSDTAVAVDELMLVLGVTVEAVPEREAVVNLLAKLEKDHYLVRSGSGNRMSSPLLARVWRLHRRLE